MRHETDLGLVPIVARDACGTGDHAAAQRSLANLAALGVAIMIDVAPFGAALRPPA